MTLLFHLLLHRLPEHEIAAIVINQGARMGGDSILNMTIIKHTNGVITIRYGPLSFDDGRMIDSDSITHSVR